MMILLFGVLNDEQRALVERIFHEHRVHFQRISFKIVKSEEAAEDVVSTAFVKIMDNIEKISELTCPQMTAFCVTIVKNASIDVLRHSQQSVHLDRWDCVSDESSDDLAEYSFLSFLTSRCPRFLAASSEMFSSSPISLCPISSAYRR